jgi:hypothetical protein
MMLSWFDGKDKIVWLKDIGLDESDQPSSSGAE